MKIIIDGAQNSEEAELIITDSLKKKAEEIENNSRPVLFLDITGKIEFDSFEIDTKKIEEAANDIINPIVASITNQASRFQFGSGSGGNRDINALFQEAILEIVKSSSISKDKPEEVMNLIFELKKTVIDDKSNDMDTIMELIHDRRMGISE
jgi:hypothetical protein